MNSYPHEFLNHPQPLMFIAGLTEPHLSTTRDRSSSILSHTSSRRPSHGATSLETGSSSIPLNVTSPLTSPRPNVALLPQSPPVEEVLQAPLGSEYVDERDKEFKELVHNLKIVLKEKSRSGKVWIRPEDKKDFKILLVDKNVRLPLRKIAPASGSSDSTPHSPLSPLTPSSPVHPDGLIAPIWVRKHAELVPSVFVLFLRLYESPVPLEEDNEDKTAREKAESEKEKEKDDELVKEIGDRRRRLSERGIKLTVVLMASSATLDSPHLDPRLSYLRRASQLSAKASLFVLTPVPADQLPDFVASLQEALYDPAMEYYGSHGKRVRRKRARIPTGQFAMSQLGEKGKYLGPQGWGVRYDWKAAWFAELRGEFDVARRHYEDCWNELARMFTSTQMLPPRTKRWAEAKVLADCVAIRICRLMLYEGEPTRITTPFFVHVKRFSDLSRGWGIGEDTFEYWSWIARQYRIFAELLELAQNGGVILPPIPPPTFPIAGPSSGPPTPEYWTTPISATNPLHALQQPAFYFYTAALCSIQRQKRFEEALEVEQDALGSEAGSTAGYVATAPGFANEKKVDHAGLVVELFTKAYTLMKEHTYTQQHASLNVAFKIAETYSNAGHHVMAMKFFERISPTFKAEKWDAIVSQIRALWYESAQATGNVEVAARLLLEMMCTDSGVEGEERASLQSDLLTLLQTTSPSTSDPIIIDLGGSRLLDVKAGFWSSQCIFPSTAPFQMIMSSSSGVDISSLRFSELHVSFSDGRADLIVHSDEHAPERIDLGELGGSDHKAPLHWNGESQVVLYGQLSSKVENDAAISTVTLVLKVGSWVIHLVLTPEELQEWSTPKGPLRPVNGLSSVVSFFGRAHDVKLDVQHHPSAYVDERSPITINVTNGDTRSLDIILSAVLESDEMEDGSVISLDGLTSSTSLEGIELGSVGSGSTVTRTIMLKSSVPGTKIIDLTITSKTDGGQPEETVHTAVVPVLPPFSIDSTVTYQTRGAGEGIATVRSVIKTNGPREIIVRSLNIASENDPGQELSRTSLNGTKIPEKWNSTTLFAVFTQFNLKSVKTSSASPAPVPGHLVFNWQSDNESIETRIPLPTLILPASQSFISATMAIPQTVHLHEPFDLSLELYNSHSTQESMINVEVSTAEAFVWKGERSSQIRLLPREKKRVEMEMICIGQVGSSVVPKVTLWEMRGLDGDERREIRVKGDSRVHVRP